MIGDVIKRARNKRGWSLDQLGEVVGLTKGTLSGYENGQPKSYDPDTLCKIADALNDISILTHHCQSCPVRNMAFIKQFPELNNIRRDPAIITARLRKEMTEAAEALDSLSELFSDVDFRARPDHKEVFERAMEQVIDAERCIEILKFELIISGTAGSLDLQKIYKTQQAKCIAHGHHKPEAEEGKAAA